MKKFKQFRESILESNKKTISGVDVKIKKKGSKFETFVDGELLDVYSSEKEAMDMAKEFIKQYKD